MLWLDIPFAANSRIIGLPSSQRSNLIGRSIMDRCIPVCRGICGEYRFRVDGRPIWAQADGLPGSNSTNCNTLAHAFIGGSFPIHQPLFDCSRLRGFWFWLEIMRIIWWECVLCWDSPEELPSWLFQCSLRKLPRIGENTGNWCEAIKFMVFKLSRIRGMLGSTLVFSCNLGILLMYILGSCLAYATIPWILLVFPVVFLAGFLLIPDTPFYLMRKNDFVVSIESPPNINHLMKIISAISGIRKLPQILSWIPPRNTARFQRV